MKEGSKEWLEKEASLKRESLVLKAKSELLKDTATDNYNKIAALAEKYPDHILKSQYSN